MDTLWRLALTLGVLATLAGAGEVSDSSTLLNSGPKLTSLDGYPGVLSREYVQEVVNHELRTKLYEKYSEGPDKPEIPKVQPRDLKDKGTTGGEDCCGSVSELNDALVGFQFDLPLEDPFQFEVLGVMATIIVGGKCGDVSIGGIGLTYNTGGDSLTYDIDVQDLDVKCQILVDWDLGALDVEDELNIRLVLKDNDFMLGVTLTGSPPTSSTFEGCNAVINVASISSTGGFSSDILNDLSDLILQIVKNEAQVISDLICGFVGDLTGAVDGVLETLDTTLAPYLTKVAKVDPLRLENEVQVEETLVNLQDSTVGDILDSFITNLRGVIGGFQINTLLELNLLDENNLFIIDLAERRRLQEGEPETCSIGLRRNRNLLGDADNEDHHMRQLNREFRRRLQDTVVQELAEPLERHLKGTFERQMQESPELFAFNEFVLETVAIAGLNTFKDSQLLEVIGKQTLRSRLSIEGLEVVVTLVVDFSLSNVNFRERVTATIPIDGISVIASFFAGLDDDVINGLTLGNFLDFDNIQNCLLSTVAALGISELDVAVKSVGTAVVSGLIAPGIDDFINTAVEAAFITYEDLIHVAIPNIFQNNVTVILNDFLDCYVRVNADPDLCPPADTGEVVDELVAGGDEEGGGGGDSGTTTSGVEGDSEITFSFRDESAAGTTTEFNGANGAEGSSSAASPSPTSNASPPSGAAASLQKSGSFISTDPTAFENAASSATADGYVKGFIDFRDLLLPPDAARTLGGSGTQPYGNLISMAFEMMKDQLVSLDNVTGLPLINTEVLQPLTEGQSGVNGMFRLPGTLFNVSVDTLAFEFLRSVLSRIDVSAFDTRIGNLNTIVSPVRFLEPTERPHVLENILNFGPVSGRPINMTVSLGTNFEGVGSSLGWSNDLDISASASQIDVATDFRVMIATKEFLQFPITDILNFNCWLALIQAPNMDDTKGDTISNALAVRSFLMNVITTTLDIKCADCVSKLLPGALNILERTGATKTLGARLGGLLEEVITVDTVPALLTDFFKLGEEAARLCPHRPTFNTTSEENKTLAFDIPPLSNQAVDTIMLAGVLGAEVMAVSFAESHLSDEVKTADPLAGQKSQILTEKDKLLDWTRLNETFIPFAGDIMGFVRTYLSGTTDGTGDLAVNDLFGDFLDDDGSMVFDLGGVTFNVSGGVEVAVHTVQVKGLDSFTRFDVLQPIAPQTLENSFALDKLSLDVDFSIHVMANSDPPRPYSVSFDVENVNATVYLYTEIDMKKVESLELGSLLFSNNLIPCFFSTASDVHIPATRVTVGNISEPIIKGFLEDSNEAVMKSMEAMLQSYGTEIADSVNSIFDSTMRGFVNDFISSYTDGSLKCENTLAEPIDSSTTVKFNGGAAILQGAKELDDFLDFRDLLLAPEGAIDHGGSGTQPYGDVTSMVFAMIKDQLVRDTEGELLQTNEMIIDPITESQSGVKGLLQFKQELFAFASQKIPIGLLDWLDERIQLRAFDARVRNINTLVSPISIFQPSHRAHVLENMVNFGPIPGKPLNATVGLTMAVEGDLSSLNMYNEFDVSASLAEVDLITDISLMVAKEELFRFPLKDILEMNCWLSLIQAPTTDGSEAPSQGFEMKSFLMKLASLSVDLQCRNCTSNVLPQIMKVMDQTGVSETLGNRLGPLIEEFSTSDIVPSLLKNFINFGEEAARFCPHSPLFNTTAMGSTRLLPGGALPALSATSLDTILFTAIVVTQIAVVMVADSHVQDKSELFDPFVTQNDLSIPEDSQLLDWTNLNNTGIPFVGDALYLVQNSLGEPTATESGIGDLGINVLAKELLGDGGSISIPMGGLGVEASGLRFSLQSIHLEGLDTFSRFDVLKPKSARTLENSMHMKKVMVGLDISLDMLDSPDPPQEVSMSIPIEDLNITMPMLALIDEGRLGNLKFGSLLHLSNILPCLLSATHGLRVQQMVVSVGGIGEPIVEGLLPETRGAIANSSRAIVRDFSETIKAALPRIFDHTVRLMINGVIANQEKKECREHLTTPASRYVDFREMFQPKNASTSPYGDLMPIMKTFLTTGLLSVNPNTQMPKINDAVIAPITQGQSGVRGSLALLGEVFGFDFDGLAEIGIDNLGVGLSDARIENLDSVGPPLEILEPNATNGLLLDNRATFGTELRPLRFAVRSSLALSGPFLNTHDVMDVFGELRGAPFLAVLLARIGSQELLSFPLKYASNLNCWLAAIAAPAFEEIALGKTEVDPVLALDYLGIQFSSVGVSASCFNCTTPGFIRLPELLDIMDASGTKDVLGRRALDMVMDTMASDFVQVWVLKFLQDSMRKCPMTENSADNSILLADADFPMISGDWIETGLFAASVFTQLTSVILAETIAVVDSELGPIFDDPEPDIPPGTRLIDFTALDTYPVGTLAQRAIKGANSFLGEASTDPETGETTLGINELLGANPIRNLATFSQKFDGFAFSISGFQIKLKELKVSGLDSFTKFQIMDIVGPTQLQNELGWKKLRVELFFEIDAAASPSLQHSLTTDDKIPFSIDLEVADIEASMELMLALDYELLKNLQLGSLLRFAHILPCIQATIRHLEISKMKLGVGKITKMRMRGFKSSDTSSAAESLEKLLLEKYGDVLANAAPSLFSVALRPLVNTAITSYIRDSDFKCHEFPFDPEGTGFIDFRDLLLSPTQSKRYGGSGRDQYGDLIRTATAIMNLQLITANPENGIEFLAPLVGSLSFPGVLLNQGIKFNVKELQADVSLRVSDLRINHLDSLGKPLTFLQVIHDEPYKLNNSATLGVGNRPVEVGARIYMHVKGLGGYDVVNDFDLTLDVHAATVVLTMLLKISEEGFVRFPLRDILNLNCWLATIPPPPLDKRGLPVEGAEPSAGVSYLDMTAKQLNLRLDCHNCSSPALSEFAGALARPETPEEMTDVVNRLLHSATSHFQGGYIQDQINRLLIEAPKHCGHTDQFDPNAAPALYEAFEARTASTASFTSMLVVIVIPIIFAVAIVLGVKQIVLRRHKKWLLGLPSERVFLIQQKQEREDQKEAELNKLTQSMYRSQDIPLFVRQLIPLIVIANIGFFLSGHLNKGGRVLIDFVFAGAKFQLDNFYTFSIGQSTVDMWHNNGKELALLILLFSGVWPYTKQLITLALWFLPPSMVSCSRRGQFLLWLDILAKWSMIDIIVMLITVIGFRLRIQSPNFAFIPEDFYSVNLLVVPMWGLYANMIAQLISQISSHFIVHYHRKIIRRATAVYEQECHDHHAESNLIAQQDEGAGGLLPSPEQEQEDKDQLCRHAFSRPRREETDRLIIRRYTNKLLLSGSLLLSVLLIASCGIPSLKLETFGVVGLLIEFGQNLQDAVRYEGVYSMAGMLNEQAKYLGGFTHHLGLGFLSFLFVMTVMVVPVVHVLTLMFQWYFPLGAKRREQVAMILEILQAWQYIEVYVLAILVESWQLGSISRLLLNRFCTGLDFTFNLLVYYGVLDENDGQCFAIEASVAAGAYLMVPIIIGLALVNAFVVKAYVQYLREKQDTDDIIISEDEKLRAFDRAHWDSREEAIESIQAPQVQFTDTFRWILRREDGGMSKLQQEDSQEDSKEIADETFQLAGTTSSDEEHGGGSPSITKLESSTSNGSLGDETDFVVAAGAQSIENQTNSDSSSVDSGFST